MNRNTGLSSEEWGKITAILSEFPEIEQANLFGSRAKGSYKPGSDVDLAISGRFITTKELRKLKFRLNEETTMPYFFDVVHLESISSDALLHHIQECGVQIYGGDL